MSNGERGPPRLDSLQETQTSDPITSPAMMQDVEEPTTVSRGINGMADASAGQLLQPLQPSQPDPYATPIARQDEVSMVAW